MSSSPLSVSLSLSHTHTHTHIPVYAIVSVQCSSLSFPSPVFCSFRYRMLYLDHPHTEVVPLRNGTFCEELPRVGSQRLLWRQTLHLTRCMVHARRYYRIRSTTLPLSNLTLPFLSLVRCRSPSTTTLSLTTGTTSPVRQKPTIRPTLSKGLCPLLPVVRKGRRDSIGSPGWPLSSLCTPSRESFSTVPVGGISTSKWNRLV